MNLSPEKNKTCTETDCERFNGTNIIESLVALGGLQIILQLVDIEDATEINSTSIIKIILHLFKCQEI